MLRIRLLVRPQQQPVFGTGVSAEAAAIDGANSWAQLWRVYLPIAKPAVVTLLLLSFLWTWNDYFLALIMVSDPSHRGILSGSLKA
jgi:ABC-type glycerol-3-phosphate transport system permease component